MAIKLVVLDGYGVIYDELGVEEPTYAFARAKGCALSEDEFFALRFPSSIGQGTSAEFWKSVGVEGDVGDIIDELQSQYLRLMPGLLQFLEQMREMKLLVACCSGDGAEESRRHRQRYGLEEWISPWVVSGEVGFRKPSSEIFQIVLDRAGVQASDCVLVDDRPYMLDVAKSMGFATVLFRSPGDAKGDGADCGYPCVSSFDELVAFMRAQGWI